MPQLSYLFIFGRTPDLAILELQTLFPSASAIAPDVALVTSDALLDGNELMGVLGGTTKIARLIGDVPFLSAQSVAPFIEKQDHIVEFGISFYGCDTVPRSMAPDVKKELDLMGIKSRYIQAKHGDSLSTVSVDKANITELIIVKNGNSYTIGTTIAVQRYEDWSKRDYDRPYADPKAGMLPPKVARMVVNIAGDPTHREHKTLLDPFCGMGTILAEGYMRGWNVTGSDIDAGIAKKATLNLSWLFKTYPATGGQVGRITACDATHISEFIAKNSVDAIVTEPYMGATNIVNNQTVTSEKVKNIIKGLEKLYIGCLRDWSGVLVPNGKLIIALPEYAVLGRKYFVKKVVDMCENLGYTIVDGPIEYSRPQATVRRQFYIFQKKS